MWGWSGGAKVLCIFHHRGVQLILAYSWARPAILVVGKGRGECFYFFCFFTFIPVSLSSLSLSFISSTLSSISFLPFSGRRHKMTLKGWRVIKPQHNQSSRHDSSKNMAARSGGLFSLYIYIENFKTLLVRNHWTDFIITLQKCFLGDPLLRLFK